MKNNTLIFVAIILAMFANSCTSNSDSKEQSVSIGFAKGAKISSSGLKTVNDGLTFKESYFIADGVKTESNEVQIGQKVAIVFEGIEGFKEKSGKVFPALSILVLDAKNQVVVTYDNLLKSETGYDVKDATMLTGSLTIGEPLKHGESYTLTVTVGDKESANGIVGNITLKIK
ncbi:MAG: hypothetical protein WC623_21240 [Pedobacter sp.]|uniref:hypothetical protein n=1 Tax=Pedobacter sp. TaxID=1411316 RepID=UPI0035686B86